MNQTLPVVELYTKAIKFFIQQKAAIAQTILPFIFYLLLTAVLSVFDWSSSVLYLVIKTLGFLICATFSCIALFHLVIDDELVYPSFSSIGWHVRESFYLLFFVLMAVIAGSIFWMIILAGKMCIILFSAQESGYLVITISSIIGFLVSLFFTLRLILILPDSALENQNNLTWAWETSGASGWQYLALLAVVPVTVKLLLTLFSGVDGFVIGLIKDVVVLSAVLFEVVLIGLFYQWQTMQFDDHEYFY